MQADESDGDDDRSEIDQLEKGDDGRDLMPTMARTDLSEEVRSNRELHAAEDQHNKERWEARIEAHIAAHSAALDFLATTHQALADELDFDLVADTRPAAAWQMTGRCIGIARLMLDGLRLGYTAEILHLARALHEADRLADLFGDQEEDDLLRKWLADEGDEWVRPAEVRAAEERLERRLAEAMTDQGLGALKQTGDLTRRLYGEQSQAAHHRRRWTQDVVFPRLRTMLRGPGAIWIRRAGTTAAMLAVVEECVMSVGAALALFQPPGWYEAEVAPFIKSFAALRDTEPLVR